MMETIHSSGSVPWAESVIERNCERARSTGQVTAKLEVKARFLDMMRSGWLQPVLVYSYGAFMVSRGSGTIGSVLAFEMLVGRGLGNIASIMSVIMGAADSAHARNQAWDVLNLQPQSQFERRVPVDFRERRSTVSFKAVTFGYGPKVVLRDFEASIPGGAITVISGESGAGKSTLGKLLIRLYEPWSGTISVGGRDIVDYEVDSIRRLVQLVPQLPGIFPMSIAENIAMCEVGDIDWERLRWASDIAGIRADAEAEERGMHTTLGEGGTAWSGGQVRRLGLARALYRQPNVLVLDEVTSAVSEMQEGAILSQIRSELPDATLIIISHRSCIAKIADQVIHLGPPGEPGRIANAPAAPERR